MKETTPAEMCRCRAALEGQALFPKRSHHRKQFGLGFKADVSRIGQRRTTALDPNAISKNRASVTMRDMRKISKGKDSSCRLCFEYERSGLVRAKGGEEGAVVTRLLRAQPYRVGSCL